MTFARLILFALCLIGAMRAFGADVPAAGDQAPPIELQQLLQAPEGSGTTWQSLRGKVVVLEFWATWCPSCIKVIPHFNELADQLKDKPVQFIAITDETRDAVVSFLANDRPGRHGRPRVFFDRSRNFSGLYQRVSRSAGLQSSRLSLWLPGRSAFVFTRAAGRSSCDVGRRQSIKRTSDRSVRPSSSRRYREGGVRRVR